DVPDPVLLELGKVVRVDPRLDIELDLTVDLQDPLRVIDADVEAVPEEPLLALAGLRVEPLRDLDAALFTYKRYRFFKDRHQVALSRGGRRRLDHLPPWLGSFH